MGTNASDNIKVIPKNEETGGDTDLDDASVKKSTAILRALNHKKRQRLIKLIDEYKRINVTDIHVRLRLEDSVTSKYLSILRDANIIIAERDGAKIYHTLNYERIAKITTLIEELMETETVRQNTAVAIHGIISGD